MITPSQRQGIVMIAVIAVVVGLMTLPMLYV
jgi:hypothetical protein